jgi:hypothetical protein
VVPVGRVQRQLANVGLDPAEAGTLAHWIVIGFGLLLCFALLCLLFTDAINSASLTPSERNSEEVWV